MKTSLFPLRKQNKGKIRNYEIMSSLTLFKTVTRYKVNKSLLSTFFTSYFWEVNI